MSEGQEGYYQQAPGDQWGVSDIRPSELAQPFPPPLPVMHGFDSQGRLLTVQAVQQWEYLQEEIPQAQWQVHLTELGAEGWEMVQQRETQREVQPGEWVVEGAVWQVPTYLPCWLCFFKRPKVTA